MFYLGCAVALTAHPACYIPFLFLLLPCFILGVKRLRRRLLLAIATALVSFLYVSSTVQLPVFPTEKLIGRAIIEVSDISPTIYHGQPFYKVDLTLHSFESDRGIVWAKNISCKWTCSDIARRPLGGILYSVRAMLTEKEGIYSLKVLSEGPWNKLKNVFSLVEWRLHAKSYFKKIMASNLPPSQSRDFLEGVLIGEFHDQVLTSQLRRFGLQHILVVSGFHFSLIAALFGLILRLFLPWKTAVIALFVIATAYLCFIGMTPSVLRAWCAISIVLSAKLLEQTSDGLNCLGIGVLVVLLIDPTFATSLSFQLSFIATLGILLFYPIFYRAIKAIFPSRKASEVITFPFLEQLTVVLLSFFCSSLALVLAVSLFVLPMSLFVFHSFPVMGILYNCFFPFVISIAIGTLCLGLLLCWIPPVAAPFFLAASYITETSLTLATHAPSWLDMTIYCSSLSGTAVVVYLCLLTKAAVVVHNNSFY